MELLRLYYSFDENGKKVIVKAIPENVPQKGAEFLVERSAKLQHPEYIKIEDADKYGIDVKIGDKIDEVQKVEKAAEKPAEVKETRKKKIDPAADLFPTIRSKEQVDNQKQ